MSDLLADNFPFNFLGYAFSAHPVRKSKNMAVIRRDCPHCPAEHVAFEIKWAQNPPHSAPIIWNCVAICGACGKPICFVATAVHLGNRESPQSMNGEISSTWHVPQIWPYKPNPSSPPHTPPPISKRFLEGEDAFMRHNWNSAVAMYRSALDIATKAMPGVPKGATFFERLAWLHANHGITPDMRAWADHVRVEGNAALHDPEEFDEADAKALRFFTEMFLRYVFELPGEVQAFRDAAQPMAGAAKPA